MLEMFSRLLILKDIGFSGIKKLQASKVLIVGAGALGSAISELLVRMGVGFIRIIDRDFVELSNLSRTHLLDSRDYMVKKPKAYAVRDKVKAINPRVSVEAFVDELDETNVFKYINGMDLIIDGLDNIETRRILNEASVSRGIPYIFAGVAGRYGNVMPIIPKRTPCLRCLGLYDTEMIQDQCEVIGTDILTVTMVSIVASKLAVDILLNKLVEGLYYIDLNSFEIKKIHIKKHPQCPICSLQKLEILKTRPKTRSSISPICGTPNTFKVKLNINLNNLIELANKINSNQWIVKRFNDVYTFQRSNIEIVILNTGLAIIKGVKNSSEVLNILKEIGLDPYIVDY